MHDVTQLGELYVIEGISLSNDVITKTPRIGISKAQDKLWRFIINEPTLAYLRKQYDAI